MPVGHRKSVRLAVWGMCLAFALALAACSTGVSQDEYDRLEADRARVQRELDSANTIAAELEAALSASHDELSRVQAELDDLEANPPIVEVDFVDVGLVARLTGLKVMKETAANSTYSITVELDLLGDLPRLTNVVDVELYVGLLFVDSQRWIDISSTGFVTTNPTIRLETQLAELPESVQLRVVPAFKVFGA